MVPKCPAQDTVTLCSIAVQVWTENAMLNRWAAFLPKSSNIKASAYAPDCGEKKKIQFFGRKYRLKRKLSPDCGFL